jgi:hypothetical protein
MTGFKRRSVGRRRLVNALDFKENLIIEALNGIQ